MELSRFPINRTYNLAPAVREALAALPAAHLDPRAEVRRTKFVHHREWTTRQGTTPIVGVVLRFLRIVDDVGARWQLADVME